MRKLSNNNKTKQCIIFGAGAVGGFLAYCFKQQKNYKNVLLFNRSPLVGTYSFKDAKNKINENFSIQVLTDYIALKSLISVDKNDLDIYICTTVGQTLFICDNLVNLCNFENKNINLIVCSNGLLPCADATKIAKIFTNANINFQIIRSLFYIGVVKKINNTEKLFLKKPQIEITYNGGNIVKFAPITKSNNFSIFYPLNALPYLQWQGVTDIQSAEKRKFFINIMLGLFIGSELQPNKLFYTKVTNEKLIEYAKLFVLLFDNSVAENDLIKDLFETISATSENINSLSYAWNSRNYALVFEFMHQLLELLDNKELFQHELYLKVSKIIKDLSNESNK